jgi:hypothetical protein
LKQPTGLVSPCIALIYLPLHKNGLHTLFIGFIIASGHQHLIHLTGYKERLRKKTVGA